MSAGPRFLSAGDVLTLHDAPGQTVMRVPSELVPDVRKLIATRGGSDT